MVDSFTILLNVALSNAKHILISLALIDAALGALYRRANSPKLSPGSQVLMSQGSASFVKFLQQSSTPESMTQRSSPFSPYLITHSPGLIYVPPPLNSLPERFLLHCIYYDQLLIMIESREHKCLIHSLLNADNLLLFLWDNSGYEFLNHINHHI